MSSYESFGIYNLVPKDRIIDSYEPIALMKSIKSDKEVQNAKIAHVILYTILF